MIQSTLRFAHKLISIILLLTLGIFTVGNFVLSTQAQTTTPAVTTPDPAAKPSTDKATPATGTKDTKATTAGGASGGGGTAPTLQYQTDPAIGGLKNCNATNAPDDPAGASRFITDCVKNIMELVVGISVILAIMSLVFLGIRSLNSFESQSAVNKEVVERIQGFTVGAVILGLFSAIIGTLNPAALNINEIFGGQVAQEIRAQVDKTKVNFIGGGGDSLGLGGDTKGATAGGVGGGTAAGGGYTKDQTDAIINNPAKARAEVATLMSCEKIVDTKLISQATCDKLIKMDPNTLKLIKEAAAGTYKGPEFPKTITPGLLSQYTWKDININKDGVGGANLNINTANGSVGYGVNFKLSSITDCTNPPFTPGKSNGSYESDGSKVNPLIPKDSKCQLNTVTFLKN